MENKKNTWEILSKINCNDKVEEKNGLKYLSWAWAWGIVKNEFPNANYSITMWDGKPYLYDEKLGYMVQTSVTINDETISMQLPVMDNSNRAMKSEPYAVKVPEYINGKRTGRYIEKRVEAATMFDINTAIMRCLTKNLAMFGLGHYIYAGEDLPQTISIEQETHTTTNTTNTISNTNTTSTTNKSKISDELLNKYLELDEQKFPYTIGKTTFNTKEELLNELSTKINLTEEQMRLIKTKMDNKENDNFPF